MGRAVSLPVVLGNVPANDAALNDLGRLAASGVRIAYQNQPAFLAAMQAQYEVMRHLHEDGDPKALLASLAPGDLVDRILRRADYDAAQRDYLRD